MSKEADYDYVCNTYENERNAAGSDVICALIQFYTGKSLKSVHVLDAGCGTGLYTKALTEYGVEKITLLDKSLGMLEVAKAKLADDIEAGTIKDVVQFSIPPIPFPDASFDVAMFNLVLNHLFKLGDKHFTECVETLKEARRILLPGGIILISTILKSTTSQNMWPTKLDKTLGERYVQMSLSLGQLEDIFCSAGILCMQKFNILGSEIFPNYITNPESYLSNFFHFVEATDIERRNVYQTIRDLKQKGELERWITEHDHTNTAGLINCIRLQGDLIMNKL